MKTMKQVRLWLIRIALVIACATALSSAGLEIQDSAVGDLFTVIGIVYTLAIGFMLGFSFQEIYNSKLRMEYTESIRRAFMGFTMLFAVTVVLHTLCPSFTIDFFWNLNLDYIYLVVMWDLFTLGFYCFNFNMLRKLRIRIDDVIREGRIDSNKFGPSGYEGM